MSDEELEELSGGVTAQTGGVKWAKKPFCAVSSGKSHFERKKLVWKAILGRDLRFPLWRNLYRAVMRIFRRMQKSGAFWSCNLRNPKYGIL